MKSETGGILGAGDWKSRELPKSPTTMNSRNKTPAGSKKK